LPPYNLDPFIENVDEKKFDHIRDAPMLSRKVQHPYHILVIGTQECQHNIQHSVFFPSKDEWESRLKNYLGDTYVLVKTETMAALHLTLLQNDQLKQELSNFPPFFNFNESRIDFNPTFKFDITHRLNHNNDEYSPLSRYSSTSALADSNSPRYDSGPKQRVPSWTDRIIFKTRLPPPKNVKNKRIDVGRYTSHMNVIGFSDHRPVTGCFFVDFDWKLEKELLERQVLLVEQEGKKVFGKF
ncbi:5729_t:CDS:2, partial [Racocetra fulgida]